MSTYRHSSPTLLPHVSAVDLETANAYAGSPVLPPFQVDYLSHAFSEEDVAASWKVMTKRKKGKSFGYCVRSVPVRSGPLLSVLARLTGFLPVNRQLS